jgi:ABC-2 type transport system permease protein
MKILRSEWLKLVSVPTTWYLLGSMLLIEGLAAGLLPGLKDIDALRKAHPEQVMIGTRLQTVFVITLGSLLMTNEFRHGTANHTFVITPRRERVIAAKLAVGLVAGTVCALLYIAVNAGLGLSILSSRGIPVDGKLAVNVYSGVGVGMVIFFLFGIALGAVLRNQVLTIIVGLVLVLSEGAFALFLGNSVGKFFPGEALLALNGTHDAAKTLLTQVDAGLVLTALVVVLSAAGVAITRYREIN